MQNCGTLSFIDNVNYVFEERFLKEFTQFQIFKFI